MVKEKKCVPVSTGSSKVLTKGASKLLNNVKRKGHSMVLSVAEVAGKCVFVGIDVHKSTYSVCTVVEGRICKRVRMPANPHDLVKWLKKGFSGSEIKSAYEAGFAGFNLHRVLDAAGISNIVVNPASIPIAANDRVKTDKRDAEKIAGELSRGGLKGIYVPSLKAELARLLPRTRAQLVKEKSRLGNQIKAKLFEFGLIAVDDERSVSLKLLNEYEALDLPTDLLFSVKILADLYRSVHAQILKVEQQMQTQAAENPKIEAIYRSVPGVGPVSSRILAAELGDMSRFPTERDLYSYTGLTPREYSSGTKERRGGITRQGNTRVRHCLVEVAWRAIKQDPALKEKYEALKMRCGGKRAIVGIARGLVGRIRACLRDEKAYALGVGLRVLAT